MKVYDKQFIDGEWRIGCGGVELKNINPYTGEVLYTYQSAGLKDIDDAYAAAEKAQAEWAKTSPEQKCLLLERVKDVMTAMKYEIYEVLQKEGGSCKRKADREYHACFSFLQEAMKIPELLNSGQVISSNIEGKDNYVIREPKGVICTIAPWNLPMLLAMRSVIPAVAAGNAVVLKPASETPASASLVAEIFNRAGAPRGLVNTIVGAGSVIGDALITHPVPKVISFTGSTEIGRHVGELAGALLKDFSLELGGNNIMIVLPDADLDAAARATAHGAYFCCGQNCMSINRAIVIDEVYDEFVEKLAERVKAIKVGDPSDPNSFIGPVISSNQRKKIEELIQGNIDAGARVVVEGKSEGNVIYPWLFADANNSMPAAANEVFGPVCSVIRAKNEDEAIAIANETEYGLAGSVFTKDLYHGLQIAKRIEAGMVHVNDQTINDQNNVMFGGVKNSGVGRFNGKWIMEKFTCERWFSVQRKYRF